MYKEIPIPVLTEAKHRISALVKKSERLVDSKAALREWINDSAEVVVKIAPGSACIEQLQRCWDEVAQVLDGLPGIPEDVKRDMIRQARREVTGALKDFLQDIEDELAILDKLQSTGDFWSDLHPDVVKVSRERFVDGHYADSVLAALKDLNDKVKMFLVSEGHRELDGYSLMTTALSPDNPIVRLSKLQTQSDKDIQKGYMNIFAGAMAAIRNPKAHSNLEIPPTRAKHFLYLASLLHQIFDEREDPQRP